MLDLHSTHSYPDPFVLVPRVDGRTLRLAAATGISKVVDIGHVSGGLIDHVDGVAVECGLTGTVRAAENAYEILTEFLASLGALDEPASGLETPPEIYHVFDAVEGSGYEVDATNFERVEAGEAFARRGGDVLTADEPFFPVLMSEEGYEGLVGFKALRVKRVADMDPEA
ncbi:hypothetical protein ACFQJD_12970 [Haloplanus sp. GCM10025708]|uniref:hypothetical protein n=1 Tax=Haloplanus sp. GCM10025708 TaxID=3252679 RepID=UPI0036217DB5